jgi:spore germination cell wall hydrolase CwlJ-like protein
MAVHLWFGRVLSVFLLVLLGLTGTARADHFLTHPAATPQAVKAAARDASALFERGGEIKVKRDANVYITPQNIPKNDRFLKAYSVDKAAKGTSVPGLLGIASQAPAARAEPDVRQEVECLALTIYFEARGEPDEGKIAVGHVVMNRASHPLFPHKVCEVVQQGGEKLRFRCQFTWWCDGRSDNPREWQAWEKSKALARRIYWDYSADPTAGALWYHADYVTPSWRNSLAPGPKIGRHIFYRDSSKS